MGKTEGLSAKARAIFQFFTWYSGLILVLTLINTLFILYRVGLNIEPSKFPNPASRSLAALASHEPKNIEYRTEVIKISCRSLPLKKAIATQGTQVRIEFKKCNNINSLENTTNGNKALIVPMGLSTHTTDLLPLNLGSNQIFVELDKKSYTVEIFRNREP